MKEMVAGSIGVTILGRAGLRYRDGSRTTTIDSEMLAGPIDFVVFVNTIKAWDAIGQPIDETERSEILINLRNVFQLNRLSVDFE